MSFNEDVVYCQFWAAIEFGSDTVVLTTRGQPFGFSKRTDEYECYRIASLEINAYVHRKEEVCIGIPGRVYFKGSPEWTQDARKYDEEKYPQREYAMLSNIRGLFAMPVFEGDRCIGVLEFVMTNSKDNFSNEMEQVCSVLKEVGLQSSSDQNKWINAKEVGLQSDHNENLDINTSKNRTTGKSRRGKADNMTCNQLTSRFGQPKWFLAKRLSVSENTISKAQKRCKIYWWPCERSKTAKSSAHLALIEGGEPAICSERDRMLKKMSYNLLMKDRAITSARAPIPETQINQTAAASENRSLEFFVEPLQNTTNDITRNMEFEHPGAGLIVPEYDERIGLIYGTSVPETQIDQTVASNTGWPIPSSADTLEDINGSSYNSFSVEDLLQNTTNHFDNWDAGIVGPSSIAPCYQTAASKTSFNIIDALKDKPCFSDNSFVYQDMMNSIEGTTIQDDISHYEAQIINQNAPNWYIEFGYSECPNFWIEDHEMNCQG